MKHVRILAFAAMGLFSAGAAAEINLDLNPDNLAFASVAVGSPASQSAVIGITFNGSGDLDGNANNGSVTSVAILNDSAGFFSASQLCVGTAFSANSPADTCSVNVQCAPNAPGINATAQLEVQFERNNGSAADVETVDLACSSILAPVTPPVPGDSRAIPVLGGFGLGMLALLLGAAGLLARSGRAGKR